MTKEIQKSKIDHDEWNEIAEMNELARRHGFPDYENYMYEISGGNEHGTFEAQWNEQEKNEHSGDEPA